VIYEHRTYYVLPGKMNAFVASFADVIVPLTEKHGGKLVGAWQSSIGRNNEFIYIMAYENLSEMERFWHDYRADEKFKEYMKTGPWVSCVENRILRPTPYSPLQ